MKNFIIFDSIVLTKYNYIDGSKNLNSDKELTNFFQQAMKEVLEENMKYNHSSNISSCNIVLQNPKKNLTYTGYNVDLWIENDEYFRYEICHEKSKLIVNKVGPYFIHVEKEKLINIDSTKYDPNYMPLKIDSLPTKNIDDLK